MNNKKYVIVIQGNYYYTKEYSKTKKLDSNINNAIIFINKTKEEVEKISEKEFKNCRCFWKVDTYEKALNDYNNRCYVIINNIKYKYLEYLNIKDACKLIKQGRLVIYKNKDYVKLFDKNTETIPIDFIIEGLWRLVERC